MKPKKAKKFFPFKRLAFRTNCLTIQVQLFLFLCSICLGVLFLVWIFSGHLLQPYYNKAIHENLEVQLNKIVSLMDTMADNDITISTRKGDILIVNTTFQSAFYHAVDNKEINLSNLCINIADTSLSYVMYHETLYPCLLHGGTSTLFGEENAAAQERDNTITVALREECFEKGEVHIILTSGEWQQMLVGKTTANGQYAVFVSASLSQVLDTQITLQALAPITGLIVLTIAMVAAWLFSRWFTQPIAKLSKASHAMANGNYAVQVAVTRPDEFGTLSNEFNNMAKQVQQYNQMQKDLLADVSHDLRTPLTLIRGYAETLRDITGAKKEKREEQLNIIIDETNRLNYLVNQILELAQLSAVKAPPKPMPIPLAAFLPAITERYEGLCTKNGWEVQLDLPEQPITIYADPNLIGRSIDNLLGNATHHIGADGILVLRAALTDNGKCRIGIEDHGKGISPEEQKLLFKRYFRARKNAGKQGTGLGLSIAQAVFEQHGFAHGIDSEPNVATVFWFDADIAPNT